MIKNGRERNLVPIPKGLADDTRDRRGYGNSLTVSDPKLGKRKEGGSRNEYESPG